MIKEKLYRLKFLLLVGLILMAQKPWTVSIPGTRNIDHLNENLGAVNIQLTEAELRELETNFSRIKVLGGRMIEIQMQVVE